MNKLTVRLLKWIGTVSIVTSLTVMSSVVVCTAYAVEDDNHTEVNVRLPEVGFSESYSSSMVNVGDNVDVVLCVENKGRVNANYLYITGVISDKLVLLSAETSMGDVIVDGNKFVLRVSLKPGEQTLVTSHCQAQKQGVLGQDQVMWGQALPDEVPAACTDGAITSDASLVICRSIVETSIVAKETGTADADFEGINVTVTDNGQILTKDVDYNLSFSSDKSMIVVTGCGVWSESVQVAYERLPEKSDINVANITVSNIVYASGKRPDVTVTRQGKKLVKNVDYEVIDDLRTVVGTGQIVIKGIGSWTGIKNVSYKVVPLDITQCSVNVDSSTYSGQALKPNVSVTYGGIQLSRSIDFSVEYSNNVEVGKGKVVVCGKGNYTGDCACEFTIIGKLEKSNVTVASGGTYSGKAKKPSVSVSVRGNKLVLNTDYTVRYESNVNAGTGYAVVTGKGLWTGSVKVPFTIGKAASSVSARNLSLQCGGSSNVGAKSSGNGKLSYKSSNVKVARVDANGKVSAVGVGTAKITVSSSATTNYKAGSRVVTVTVSKRNNSLVAKGKTVKFSYVKVKNKAQVVLVLDVSKAVGKVSYAKVSGSSAFSVNAKSGKLTVKKGTKKGTYTIKIRVNAAGDTKTLGVTKTVAVKIKIS